MLWRMSSCEDDEMDMRMEVMGWLKGPLFQNRVVFFSVPLSIGQLHNGF